MNKIVCDASSLISLSETCLLPMIKKMKTEFYIPKAVKKEIIDKPLNIRRFELKAMLINKYLKDLTLKVYDREDRRYSKKIFDLANSLFEYEHKKIRIIQEGEAHTVGCLRALNSNTLLVDERTMRLLIEDIDMLQDYIEGRRGYSLWVNEKIKKELEKQLSKIKVIRSTELFAYAYENNLIKGLESKEGLKAGLFALKFAGCSITTSEIDDYMRIIR